MSQAPRLALQGLRGLARGAVLAGALVAGVAGARAEAVGDVVRLGTAEAWFAEPTRRYGHDVLGGLPGWGVLCLRVQDVVCVRLSEVFVFEDIAPRLSDLDGDGIPEAIVVESHARRGAALVVYRLQDGALQRIATPSIGTRYRWLAPAAIADLDGDGVVELAYVDRPHLAKRLRIWRFQGGALDHVADQDGLTNHRIGETFISGGLRDCGSPEIILANANWSRLLAVRFDGEIQTRDIGPLTPNAMQAALRC